MALQSRENPFFPTESIDEMPITSNQIVSYPPLSRAAITLPDQARVLEEVTISYKNLDGSIDKKSIQVNKSVDWHIPLFISQSYVLAEQNLNKLPKKRRKSEKVDFKFINFSISKKEILIHTKDKLIRNFLLISPHRIVIDFRRDANFLSYEKALKTVPFTELRMGNHDGYYRIVIHLDGRYRYVTKTTDSGYRIRVL